MVSGLILRLLDCGSRKRFSTRDMVSNLNLRELIETGHNEESPEKLMKSTQKPRLFFFLVTNPKEQRVKSCEICCILEKNMVLVIEVYIERAW